MIISSLYAQKKVNFPEIGIVQNYENDSLLQAQGYKYLVESTQKIFSPKNVSGQQFQVHLQKLKILDIPLYGSNLFIPGELKVVGPEVDENAVLSYVEVVFQRAKATGIGMVLWGSGGSRQIPEGFDRKAARIQFVSMAKKVSALAEKYDITLALENLNSTEGNFINTLAEAFEIVKDVNHKNFRLCADIYHMLKEGESPEIIKKTKGYLVYCEIAEKEGRTPPGVNGEDFKPFFNALKSIGYDGKVMLECRWENLAEQGDVAYLYLQGQIEAVYGR
ncbi:MAG: sugar phosphate isomerase/epimerase [Bacteroidota bacterium]|nr:sugar phosphate isomerase/epimerase [Bacteroidota bacterium]